MRIDILSQSSWPATGSRERAPDDGLRRAIQYAAASRFKHRPLEYWITRMRGHRAVWPL